MSSFFQLYRSVLNESQNSPQKLYCYSQPDFIEAMNDNGWTNSKKLPSDVAIISIGSTIPVCKYYADDDYGRHFFKSSSNVLNLNFDDILKDYIDVEDGIKAIGMTDEQAKQSVDFIDKHIDCDFYIHCKAGVSRSQAFVKYIQDMYPDHDWETREDNPCLHPNIYVSNKLKRAKRGSL